MQHSRGASLLLTKYIALKPSNLFIIINLETKVGDFADVEPIQAEKQMLLQMAWNMI